MKTKEFVCDWNNMVWNGVTSKNIEKYMKRALEKGDAIYFYLKFSENTLTSTSEG